MNLIFIKGRSIFNVRTGFETANMDFTFWINNLLDDDTATYGGTFGTNLNIQTQTLTANYAPRRQFGVTGTYKF